MSKRQRGTRRPSNLYRPTTEAPAQGDPADPSATEPSRVTGVRTGPSGSTVTSRSARRRARTTVAAKPKSPLERYRSLLLAGFAIAGVAIIAFVFFSSASAAPYICEGLLTPGPTDVLPTPGPTSATTPSPSPSPSPSPTAAPSPSGSPSGSESPAASESPASASPTPSVTPVPSPTLRLGFPTKDLGRNHMPNGTQISYGFCPPTSGNHYNDPNYQAPMPRSFSQPGTALRPGNWIHNLEHGYVVILYKGTPDQATLDSMKQVYDSAAGDAFSASCQKPNRIVVVRFDDMDTPFAVLAWDRALLLPSWDPVAAKTFAEQWQDSPAVPELNSVC